MKRLKKIILWAIIVFVIVIVVGVGGIILFFPKEKVKQMAIDKISTSLDRKVTIDDISVSFLGGIGAYLEGIKIDNPEGFKEPYFLQAEALDIKLQFWPLLRKEVQIDKLILVKPEILLHKLPDGSINYHFGAATAAAGVPEAVEKLPEESKVALAAISFDNMAVEKGRCDFIDDSSKMDVSIIGLDLESKLQTTESMAYHAYGDFAIDSLLVTLDTTKLPALATKADYDVVYDMNKNSLALTRLDVDVNGIKASVKGDIPDFDTFNGSKFDIVSGQVAITDALTFLSEEQKASIKDYKISGKLSLKASATYDNRTKDTLSYDADIALGGITITGGEIPGQPMVDSAGLIIKNNKAEINIFKASLDKNEIHGMATVTDFNDPSAKGKFMGGVDLASLNRFLPKTGNPKLAGNMKFDISFYGPVKNYTRMQLSGGMTITNASYAATTLPEPIESLNLDASIKSSDINIKNLSVKFPSSDFVMSGTMANALPYFMPGHDKKATKPNLEFKLTSTRFDVDKLFPEVAPGEGVNPTELPIDSLPPIILPDINGHGTAAIDTLIYTKVQFTNISGDVIIKDRRILIENAKGDVYTGKVTGETTVDLNDFEKPKYSGKFDAKQVETDDFLTRFTKFGGHLFGKLDVSGSFSTEGWEPDSIMKTLTMQGKADIREAKLINFDLIKKLAETAKFKTFEEEKIKDLTTGYTVKDGRVSFDELKLNSNFGDWKITGSAGFDGSLSYSGTVLLSEKVSSDLMSQSGLVSSLAGMLKQQGSERVNIPFTLGGTYSSPKFSLDLSFKDMLQEKAKDDIKEKATDAIKSLFKKK
jgi:hypothetical protein